MAKPKAAQAAVASCVKLGEGEIRVRTALDRHLLGWLRVMAVANMVMAVRCSCYVDRCCLQDVNLHEAA